MLWKERKTFLRPQVSPAGRLRRAGLGRAWGRAGGVGIWLALAAGLTTCGPDANCLTSTGPIRTEQRPLPTDLLTVYTYDNVDLLLVQDTAAGAVPYAEVRAGQHLLGGIETRSQGQELFITNNARCNWARSYDAPCEVTLHVPHLLNVFLRGFGNVRTVGRFRQQAMYFHLEHAGDMNLDVETDYFWLAQYEVGDVTVRGHTRELNLTVEGNGRFFGQNLQTQQCYFSTKRGGNGDAHVLATEALGGTIGGNGTVYYAGRPAYLDVRLTGHGHAQPVL